MATVSIYEAKTHLSQFVAQAEHGEEIVISRHGRPVARLVPLAAQSKPRRAPGDLKGRIRMAADWKEWTEQDEADWYGGDILPPA